jgi:hypothetical protein
MMARPGQFAELREGYRLLAELSVATRPVISPCNGRKLTVRE